MIYLLRLRAVLQCVPWFYHLLVLCLRLDYSFKMLTTIVLGCGD
jgi:hypothetical protein